MTDPSNAAWRGFGPENLVNKLTAAQGNVVTVDYADTGSNKITGGAYGAYRSDSVEVSDNRVDFKNGAAERAYGGFSEQGNAARNKVDISGGRLEWAAYGGYSQRGDAVDNTVTLNNGTVSTVNGNNGVFGGYSLYGNASGNRVVMNDGNARYLYGGHAGHPASNSGMGDATGNSVTVNGGHVTAYGINTSAPGTISGGESRRGNATGNSVTINGGVINANVYGGYVADGTGNATGNSITISGSPTLGTASLYGGGGGTGDKVTGNTLNVNSKWLLVKRVANFERYNFYLPADITYGQRMLSVTEAVDISGSTIGVGIASGPALRVGDTVTLLNSPAGLTAGGINARAVGLQGIARIYDFNLSTDANNLYATAVTPTRGAGAPAAQNAGRLNPRVQSLAEGRAASLAHISLGADMVAGPGMSSALDSIGNAGGVFTVTGGTGNGYSPYRTGSHVDVDSESLLSGMGSQKAFEFGNLLVGGFFESGQGDYSSNNSFSNAASVKAKGNTSYTGGGFLGRLDHNLGLYAEGSFRAGSLKTDYRSGDLVSGEGERASYESSSPYYGLHAGLGYLWQASEMASLDFSAKYLWSHQGKDSVTIAGDKFHFRSGDSMRLRGGVRLGLEFGETLSSYAGAYYEHEFDGQTSATVNGFNIEADDISGGTGLGELGLTWTPAGADSLSLGLGLHGYTGVREGVAGNVQFKWAF